LERRRRAFETSMASTRIKNKRQQKWAHFVLANCHTLVLGKTVRRRLLLLPSGRMIGRSWVESSQFVHGD
jgi:hypothetical protein